MSNSNKDLVRASVCKGRIVSGSDRTPRRDLISAIFRRWRSCAGEHATKRADPRHLFQENEPLAPSGGPKSSCRPSNKKCRNMEMRGGVVRSGDAGEFPRAARVTFDFEQKVDKIATQRTPAQKKPRVQNRDEKYLVCMLRRLPRAECAERGSRNVLSAIYVFGTVIAPASGDWSRGGLGFA